MKPNRSFAPLAWLVVSCTLALSACQGNSPLSPSEQNVVLRGTVSGSASAGGGNATAQSAAPGRTITVSLLGKPPVADTVAADGSFVLRGLPPGDFTLLFDSDGKAIGRLTFGSVLPNQEITIVIDVGGNVVTLVDEKRTAVDVEIDGLVDQVVALNARGESQFRIAGYIVIARPGETAIREGNTPRLVSDVTAGRRVHVKGVWTTLSDPTRARVVLAHEIVL